MKRFFWNDTITDSWFHTRRGYRYVKSVYGIRLYGGIVLGFAKFEGGVSVGTFDVTP